MSFHELTQLMYGEPKKGDTVVNIGVVSMTAR